MGADNKRPDNVSRMKLAIEYFNQNQGSKICVSCATAFLSQSLIPAPTGVNWQLSLAQGLDTASVRDEGPSPAGLFGGRRPWKTDILEMMMANCKGTQINI